MRLIFTSLCCSLLVIATSAQKIDTLYYSVVANGFITGMQKSWVEIKNQHHYIYYYNDRGRGDSVNETLITNNDGQIISSSTLGVDYVKSPYTASFSIVNDSAVWITNGVRKTEKNNNQLYNQNIAPATQEVGINWLNKQTNHKGFVLLNDSIRLSGPSTKKIRYNNKTLTLYLYTFYYGQDPTPSYTWIADNKHFFAGVGGWGGTIVKGYEKLIDTLVALQESASAIFFAAQVRQYSTSLKNKLHNNHTTIINKKTASTQTNISREIKNGKIVSIFSSAKSVTVHVDTVIDAKGKFLMPGLWDMHSHYNKEDGIWYLAGGVTHVRDMGNVSIVQTWQQQIRANHLLGPDISYLSGFIDKEDPLQGPVGKIVPTLDEALKAIDYYHQRGYNQIKIYSSIKPEWVKPMADHAHKSGMRVAGHVPAFMTAAQAINAGYNEITHNNMIFLNFMGADTLATNGIVRLKVPALLSGTIDLESEQVQSFIQLMKKKSISHDPTLRLLEAFYTQFIGDTDQMFKPIIDWLPESQKKNLANTSSFATEEQKPAYRASFKNAMKMVKLLFDNGILLVAGTDGGDAIALQRELEIYNLAGIPAEQVLKIATYNAVKDCGLENTYGEIKASRDADLILIDGDPTKNISDIRKVEWVIKNERIY
jgi:imidazolonepropionase-like amidohydrolase